MACGLVRGPTKAQPCTASPGSQLKAAFPLHFSTQSFPASCHATCLARSTIVTAGLGCVFPTLLLRVLEQRSRATFARLLRAAAADL